MVGVICGALVVEEAKAHGVGQARNRVQKAVERSVPLGFLAQTITVAWYALHGDPQADLDTRRRSAPWYRQKATISYADMLAALRRELIRHEYWAQAPAGSRHPARPKQLRHIVWTEPEDLLSIAQVSRTV